MKIKMLDTVEDANVFTDPDEIKQATSKAAQKFARTNRSQTANGKMVIVRKVDRLRKGETYDVPKSQGEHLVGLDLAEEASE